MHDGSTPAENIKEIALLMHNDLQKLDIRFISPLSPIELSEYVFKGAIYGVATDSELRLWILNRKGWSQVKADDLLISVILSAIYQRLKLYAIIMKKIQGREQKQITE